MNATEFVNMYREEGIVVFDDLFSEVTIQRWNQKTDALFTERSNEEGSYVRVEVLRDTGILEEVLSPEIRKMIRYLEPNPDLYYFHCYEIAGDQLVSHIMGHSLDGWHRDADVPATPSDVGADAYSIFVYLTDVATKSNGAFEFIPKLRHGDLTNGHPTMVVTGQPGRAFFWNRHHFHRANPNSAPVRQRVLKLSVQKAGIENSYLETYEPRRVADAFLGSDPFVARLHQALAQ